MARILATALLGFHVMVPLSPSMSAEAFSLPCAATQQFFARSPRGLTLSSKPWSAHVSIGHRLLRRRQCAMQVKTEEDKDVAVPEVVCVDGLCAVADDPPPKELTPAEYWGPRALFLGCCVAYGTNFAFGRFMNEALEPSVVSGLRFSLAALVLAPFLKDMRRELLADTVLMSLCIAAAYIGQSIALQSVQAGKVGFICSLSVIVCPLLEILLDNKQASAGLLAAVLLSVAGVGVLELTGEVGPAVGDVWALAQPVGFGVGYYLTEKQMRAAPDMTLPITAVQTAVVAACALAWMAGSALASGHLTDGSLLAPVWADHSGRVAGALLWTGVATTAVTRVGETRALAALAASEAAVLMTSEPLWAALWGSLLLGEAVGPSARAGGALIVLACAANIVDPVSARAAVAEAGEAVGEAVGGAVGALQEASTTLYRQGSAAARRLRSVRDSESEARDEPRDDRH